MRWLYVSGFMTTMATPATGPNSAGTEHTGNPWPEDQVTVADDGNSAQLTFRLDQARVWVAGQEVLADSYYNQWMDDLESHPDVTTLLVGKSTQGRPLILAETPDRPEFVLMIGRQHPPEVTGAIAMRAFIDTVLADTTIGTPISRAVQNGIRSLDESGRCRRRPLAPQRGRSGC